MIYSIILFTIDVLLYFSSIGRSIFIIPELGQDREIKFFKFLLKKLIILIITLAVSILFPKIDIV